MSDAKVYAIDSSCFRKVVAVSIESFTERSLTREASTVRAALRCTRQTEES